jgi:hypothetical protein
LFIKQGSTRRFAKPTLRWARLKFD